VRSVSQLESLLEPGHELAAPLVSSFEAPKQVHPLALRACSLYESGRRNLSPEALLEIYDGLLELFSDKNALAHALSSLGALATMAEQHGSRQAAVQLAELIRSTRPAFENKQR
jgi:hypothetical protein